MANFNVWVVTVFIAFRPDSILNKQKLLKKITGENGQNDQFTTFLGALWLGQN
jgi:hypothetical protein